ncbi:MAG: alpha/beta hydrolase domain-containing protein [Lysobacterales bacterium]
MAIFIAITIAPEATARVDSLRIRDRLTIEATEHYPAYERLSGTVRFSVDPAIKVNRRISDISLAKTTHPHEWVMANANFMILRPLTAPANPVALLEISNRGGKAALRYFQNAKSSLTPSLPEHFGDGLLMRQGITLVWVGWQWDVPNDDPAKLRLEVPEAPSRDPVNYGLVRSDWVVDKAARLLPLSHRNHQAYRPARSVDPRNVLTRRRSREGQREVVPRNQWEFVFERNALGAKAPHLKIDDGAQPGFIYELTYVAKDPKLAGMGLAAVRDMASWLKHDAREDLRVNHVLGFGVSQTGRFARHFLYQGFNEDEQGRRVFDGLLIHTAGAGRGSFNHRFAQPSRDGHRYSAFFYPTDVFPFSSASQTDPITGNLDGLLAAYNNAALLPKIFYTNSGYEYWGRAAALIHTRVDGAADMPPLANERIYHLASGQHYVGPGPSDEELPENGIWPHNPLNFLVNLRALIMGLNDWVVNNTAPPESRYPSIADKTLVSLDDYQFPAIPDVAVPNVAHVAYRADYGRRWRQGIVDKQPPTLGPRFPSLVPAVDAYGNELGGIRNLEIAVPAATFTPWSLREGLPNPSELKDFQGMMVALRHCQILNDDRPALAPEIPLREIQLAAEKLIEQGYVLAEDRRQITDRALSLHRWARDIPCRETPAAIASGDQR